MKNQNISKLVVAVAVAAVALLGACSKQAEPAGHSENDGHNHAKTNSSAPEDHTGHNHGPGETTPPPAK